jgi:hypothetical protein
LGWVNDRDPALQGRTLLEHRR